MTFLLNPEDTLARAEDFQHILENFSSELQSLQNVAHGKLSSPLPKRYFEQLPNTHKATLWVNVHLKVIILIQMLEYGITAGNNQ